MRVHHISLAILAAGGATVASAQAEEAAEPSPAVFRQLVGCRAIAESVQRLRCYDERVAALAQAEEQEEVVIADPAMIRETRQTRIARADEPEFETIESTIAATGQSAADLVLILADGGRWRQIDNRPTYPRVGQTVHIREAALGSYLATIDGGRAIRVTPLRD